MITEKVKVYAKTVEDTAAAQIKEMSECEAYKDCTVRIMPDCHAGAGCTIGTVIALGGRCETEAKFTELLDAEGFSVERKAVKEVAYVAKKGSDSGDDNTQTGGNTGGNTGGGELEG